MLEIPPPALPRQSLLYLLAMRHLLPMFMLFALLASTMADGWVRFMNMPTGDYILSISSGGEERQSFKFYVPSMR